MGELEVQHCWGSLWVLPMVDALRGPTSERSAIGATSVATLLLLEADDDMRGPTSERSAAGATSVVTLNTRPGRLVGLRPVCPGHHMVPERLVGLRLVSSGLRGSRGTAGRCCGQCVQELLRVEARFVLGMSLGAESIGRPCALSRLVRKSLFQQPTVALGRPTGRVAHSFANAMFHRSRAMRSSSLVGMITRSLPRGFHHARRALGGRHFIAMFRILRD